MTPDTPDTPAPTLKIHVLGTSPGVELLPLASVLGLGGGLQARSAADRRIYRGLQAMADQSLEVTADCHAADVLLHPHDALDHADLATQASRRAGKLGIPTAFFSTSDRMTPSRIEWGTLWRTSADKRRLRSCERIATGDVPDLLEERSQAHPVVLPWRPTPSIGFIGHVATGVRSLSYLRKGWQNYYGFTLRDRVLRAIEGSTDIETRFIRRTTNLGPPMAGIDAHEGRRKNRAEYVDSVFNCDYALCIRGAGNWSFRFFEALSAGRIPVMIDTESALPLESDIDWDRHMCRIPIAMIHQATQLINVFHSQHCETEFENLQRSNRRLWQEYLAPSRFIIHALRKSVRQ